MFGYQYFLVNVDLTFQFFICPESYLIFLRWQSFIFSFALVLVKNKEHNLHISLLFGFDWYFLWGPGGVLEKECFQGMLLFHVSCYYINLLKSSANGSANWLSEQTWPTTCFWKQFHWNTVLFIHLHVVYGCFPTVTIELSIWQKRLWSRHLKNSLNKWINNKLNKILFAGTFSDTSLNGFNFFLLQSVIFF